MRFRRLLTSVALLTLGLSAAQAAPFQDVLDTPAVSSALAAQSLLNGVAVAGKRWVAVGQRGHIVYSDDQGKTWVQARVPVSADLVAVSFPTSKQGWAVGHDGVVLHTTDGGAIWERQLDGRRIGRLMADFYAATPQQAGGDGDPLTEDVRRIVAQGADNSLLDVWFADERTGYVVGAFNLIFRTRDGGATWEPLYHRTDNPSRFHLYAVRGTPAGLFVAGEQGLVMRLDERSGRFVPLDTGYRGSFFGLAAADGAVVVHGLRGHVFRSIDGGASWNAVAAGLQDGITASAACGGRRLLLVSQTGSLLASEDAGEHFRPIRTDVAMPAFGVSCPTPGTALIVGARGARSQAIR